MNKKSTIVVTQIIKEAIEVYKANFALFVSMGLIYGLLGAVAEKVLVSTNIYTTSRFLIANMLIACYVIVMLIFASSKIYQEKNTTLKESWNSVGAVYFRYVSIYFSLFLMMAFGFILLVLPGIYLATIFMFTDLIIVLDKKATYIEAFSRSYDLVQGRFWKVLQFLMAIVIISVIPSFLAQLFTNQSPQIAETINRILAVVIMPFYIIAQVGLYEALKANPVTDDI